MKAGFFAIISSFLLLASCTKEQVQQTLGAITGDTTLTNEQVISGLKEALNVGTDTSVSVLSKLDGYYKDEIVKILLPPEAQAMYSHISQVPGGQTLIDNTILAMNRAAEDASKEATPIFKDAILSMTIEDGFHILNGNDTAATAYLNGKTYNPLKNAFQPKIQASLSKPIVLGISAEDSYKNLIDAYNLASLDGLLFDKVTTNSLSEHVTTKGLNGLFIKVADQEKKIRKDPLAQVTDLLKKVFGHK